VAGAVGVLSAVLALGLNANRWKIFAPWWWRWC
jgi:hypothetical protein